MTMLQTGAATGPGTMAEGVARPAPGVASASGSGPNASGDGMPVRASVSRTADAVGHKAADSAAGMKPARRRKARGALPDIVASASACSDSAESGNRKGRVIIHTVTPEDREPVRAECRQAHANTILADIPFSEAKFDKAADRVLSGLRNTVGLVAELDGRIVGAAWASAGSILSAKVLCSLWPA